ncbi:MAG: alpha/beta hydrolase [Cyanobium sp. CACIAM 14]|nr:MAG: alpha/beta hydrolase [Cyanobium sp. CACIAM 14]
MPAGPDPLLGERLVLRRGVSLQVCHMPGRAPSLVFLHGALGNRFNWRPQIEFGMAQGWECLAYDQAGHGQSTAYPRYSIGRHCRDLGRLLLRFGITTPLLVAHSYGVPIALEWARRRAVRGLVLAAGGTHDLDPWWEKPLMRLMRAGGRQLFRWPAVQELNRGWLSGSANPAMDRFFRESPIPVTGEPYRSVEIFWGYNFHRRPAPVRWPRIPALILSGGRDPMFTLAMGEALAGRFDQGRHLHLSQCGHLLMAEEPETVNRAIAAWIQEEGLVQESRT